MTDLTTSAPGIIRRTVSFSIKLPRLDIGRAFGQALEAFGHALNLTYVLPYHRNWSRSSVVLEGSEKGRDSNW